MPGSLSATWGHVSVRVGSPRQMRGRDGEFRAPPPRASFRLVRTILNRGLYTKRRRKKEERKGVVDGDHGSRYIGDFFLGTTWV